MAVARREPEGKRLAEHAAALLPALLLVLVVYPASLSARIELVLVVALLWTVLGLLPASCLASGPWYAAIVGCSAAVHWILAYRGMVQGTALPLALLAMTVVLVTVWPFVTARSILSDRWDSPQPLPPHRSGSGR